MPRRHQSRYSTNTIPTISVNPTARLPTIRPIIRHQFPSKISPGKLHPMTSYRRQRNLRDTILPISINPTGKLRTGTTSTADPIRCQCPSTTSPGKARPTCRGRNQPPYSGTTPIISAKPKTKLPAGVPYATFSSSPPAPVFLPYPAI